MSVLSGGNAKSFFSPPSMHARGPSGIRDRLRDGEHGTPGPGGDRALRAAHDTAGLRASDAARDAQVAVTAAVLAGIGLDDAALALRVHDEARVATDPAALDGALRRCLDRGMVVPGEVVGQLFGAAHPPAR